jgi:hypothetical protein
MCTLACFLFEQVRPWREGGLSNNGWVLAPRISISCVLSVVYYKAFEIENVDLGVSVAS